MARERYMLIEDPKTGRLVPSTMIATSTIQPTAPTKTTPTKTTPAPATPTRTCECGCGRREGFCRGDEV